MMRTRQACESLLHEIYEAVVPASTHRRTYTLTPDPRTTAPTPRRVAYTNWMGTTSHRTEAANPGLFQRTVHSAHHGLAWAHARLPTPVQTWMATPRMSPVAAWTVIWSGVLAGTVIGVGVVWEAVNHFHAAPREVCNRALGLAFFCTSLPISPANRLALLLAAELSCFLFPSGQPGRPPAA